MAFKDLKNFIVIVFSDYGFSEFSKIGKQNYDDYIRLLNPHQTWVYQEGDLKKIQWQDLFTLYVAVFNKDGEFVCVEREVWYEYKFPFYKKKVIFDTYGIIKRK